MDTVLSIISEQFTWGLMLGLLIAGFSFWNHLKTKRDLKRYQRHLSDKMELEAQQLERLKQEREKLTKENEHLRLKVGMLNEKPEHKQSRDLEILTRAEKRMMINAPGFAAAWETAKAEATTELEAEDRGMSLPKRLFSKLLGTSGESIEDAVDTSCGKDSPSEKEQSSPEEPGPEAKVS